MLSDIIISCALTGASDGQKINTAVPVAPAQIANEAIVAAAAVVHIHVRDPETGSQSMEARYYRDVVDRIRRSGIDIIINPTTGPGARYTPSTASVGTARHEPSSVWRPKARSRK